MIFGLHFKNGKMSMLSKQCAIESKSDQLHSSEALALGEDGIAEDNNTLKNFVFSVISDVFCIIASQN